MSSNPFAVAPPPTIPIGTIIPWGGNKQTNPIPAGWLLCDGSALQRTGQYNALFMVIGDLWGPGDNVNTFNIPDLRGYFLRGADHGRGVDPDASTRTDLFGNPAGDRVGSFEGDQFRIHGHSLSNSVSGHTGSANDNCCNTTAVDRYGMIMPVSAQPNGGNETRPKNASVEFLIKF